MVIKKNGCESERQSITVNGLSLSVDILECDVSISIENIKTDAIFSFTPYCFEELSGRLLYFLENNKYSGFIGKCDFEFMYIRFADGVYKITIYDLRAGVEFVFAELNRIDIELISRFINSFEFDVL